MPFLHLLYADRGHGHYFWRHISIGLHRQHRRFEYGMDRWDRSSFILPTSSVALFGFQFLTKRTLAIEFIEKFILPPPFISTMRAIFRLLLFAVVFGSFLVSSIDY